MMERHPYLSASGCQELLVLSPHCKERKEREEEERQKCHQRGGGGLF